MQYEDSKMSITLYVTTMYSNTSTYCSTTGWLASKNVTYSLL